MNERVLLLHGLHMHAWAMRPFARLLAGFGCDTDTFGYYSVLHNIQRHSKALIDKVEADYEKDNTLKLHFVGHSLGGLVLRHFAAQRPDLVRGRIVTLGTPHQGSQAAVKIHGWGLGVPVLGGSFLSGLNGEVPPLPVGIELGSLAGNQPLGLGRLLRLEGENDGTVGVAETCLENMADHVVLPLSHTGMLFSKDAAAQSAWFLRQGRFMR
ncbi:acetyltransferase [Neisseria arctica]|uniref:Acetyltransferase n=1 Tax=Neisseria arctica TaxID=1470200 RepID=A0A0J1C2Y9_9NEIS|nr:alpha/beta fold hydrolase [Neisseria arctica]KLT72683.1 acetyltransferase [Neisseria arctica]UOO86231.1 alpha/beta fold hydrolase [Neisseria arctica]